MGIVKQSKSQAKVGTKPARVAKVNITGLPRDPATCQHSHREHVEVPPGRHNGLPRVNASWCSLSPPVYSPHGSGTRGDFDIR